MARLRKHTSIFYCTHILDDVQQVSDTVAILNHGELIAQAPLQELLVGSEGIVYTLVLEGDTSAAFKRITSLPWVLNIRVQSTRQDQTTWEVAVTDEAAAKTELLKLVICDEHLTVIEFGRHKHELEEIFLSIVEGGQNVKH